jgi:hypothetical protein
MTVIGTASAVHFFHITRSGPSARITGSSRRSNTQNLGYYPNPPFVPGVRFKKKSRQVSKSMEVKMNELLAKMEQIDSLIDKKISEKLAERLGSGEQK